MANVVELRPEAVARERQRELTSVIGMMVALGAWGMMFASVLFVYVGLRSQTLAWPPPGLPPLPLALPAINTLVILASSATLVQALGELRQGRSGGAIRWMGVTFILGCAFVALQGVLWHVLYSEGITTATGALGTVVYGLTILHAVHVAAGLAVLGYLLVVALRGAAMRERTTTLRLCGMFWHFVDAVWVVMFLGLFVL
jgi:heme/copper-type cytochrome/quinol oxidase subunit 3